MEADLPPLPSGPDRRAELIGCTLFLTLWGLLFVVARLIVRFWGKSRAGWDDLALIISSAAGIAGMGLTIAAVVRGYGRSIGDVPNFAEVPHAMKYSNFSILCNGVAMGSLKVSLGLSLLRVRLSKFFNIVVWIAMILSVLVNFLAIPSTLAMCTPMRKIWNKDPTIEGTCWPNDAALAFSYTQTAGNVVTDLLFTLGPLVYLREVKVSRYNKWALRGVFLIGLTATACAIAKCTELPALMKTQDPTAAAVTLTIWVFAELNAGLMAASIPALKSTFESVLRRFGASSGLVTSQPTYGRNGYASGGGGRDIYGRDGLYGKGTMVRSGYDNITLDDERIGGAHHGDAYELRVSGGGMGGAHLKSKSRTEVEARSIEEDQKYILQNQAGEPQEERAPWGITKTVEYSVSDDTISVKSRGEREVHAR